MACRPPHRPCRKSQIMLHATLFPRLKNAVDNGVHSATFYPCISSLHFIFASFSAFNPWLCSYNLSLGSTFPSYLCIVSLSPLYVGMHCSVSDTAIDSETDVKPDWLINFYRRANDWPWPWPVCPAHGPTSRSYRRRPVSGCPVRTANGRRG